MVKVNIHGRKIEDFTISGDSVEVATEIGVMLERIHLSLPSDYLLQQCKRHPVFLTPEWAKK